MKRTAASTTTPRIIGALILGVVVDAAVRYISSGSYVAPHAPQGV